MASVNPSGEVSPQNSNIAGCTIIAKNYLAMARVLCESFQRHHPGSPFFVLFLDDIQGFIDPSREAFHCIEATDIGVPNFRGLVFKYNVLEASTAVKPYLLQYLFNRYSVNNLIYFDPDILITSRLEEVQRLLLQHNIVLTPHVTSPYTDDARPGDLEILRAGSYNLGFIAIRKNQITEKFLRWWQTKVYHFGLIAFEMGLFVDQKWVELAPSMFDGVYVLRNTAYNVAYWNFHERKVELKEDTVLVNGEPCRFLHFSGVNPARLSQVSKHQNRYRLGQLGDLKLLFERYRDLLIEKGWNESHHWKYTYNYFDNGWEIPDAARRYYWSLGENTAELGDPFTWMSGDKTEAVHGATITPWRRVKPSQPPHGPFGLNVIGYLRSEKGVGEGARMNIRGLRAAEVPFSLSDFEDSGSANVEHIDEKMSTELPYPVNLININADQLPYYAQRRPDSLKGKYNVGFWNWELAQFPPEWQGAFDYLDEVWVPSTFTQASVASVSPIPVHCIPYSINPKPALVASATRQQFGIDPNTFVFLFIFDVHSFLARKNPLGLIRAFRSAFGDSKQATLLLKAAHAENSNPVFRELQTAAGNSNVRFLTRVLAREEINSLLSLADCYVSLHRSEGFGLTLTEAMTLGKPVIATAYSSNMDFMDSENSFPVRYRMIEIQQDHGPYKKGYRWADPELDHAAELMLRVFRDREGAARVAEQGKKSVFEKLHPSVTGAILRQRLQELPVKWQEAAKPPTSLARESLPRMVR